MNLTFRFFIGLFIAFVPMSAFAMQKDTWKMDQKQIIDEKWQYSGEIEITHTNNGIHVISGPSGGMIKRPVKSTFYVSVVSLTYTSPKTNLADIVWHNPKQQNEEYIVAPIKFPESATLKTLHFSLDHYDVWTGYPDTLGIRLPPNMEITISEIELKGWNVFEKSLEAFKSFWVFDYFAGYSINFLWGPRIAYNPIAREQIFTLQPPSAPSANGVLYIVIFIGCVLILFIAKTRKYKSKEIFKWIFAFIACMWIIYDFRMGAEFINYVNTDYKSYYSKNIGERIFRERSYFNDFADSIALVVADKEKYIFLAPSEWPYIGIIKYTTYPALPVNPFGGNAHLYDTWVVYKRPDIKLINNRLVSSDNAVLSPAGTLIHEYDDDTFIFVSDL